MHSLSPFCATTLFDFMVYYHANLSPFPLFTLFGCTAGKDFSRMFPIGSSYKRHCTCTQADSIFVFVLFPHLICCLLFICNLCDLINQSAPKELCTYQCDAPPPHLGHKLEKCGGSVTWGNPQGWGWVEYLSRLLRRVAAMDDLYKAAVISFQSHNRVVRFLKSTEEAPMRGYHW